MRSLTAAVCALGCLIIPTHASAAGRQVPPRQVELNAYLGQAAHLDGAFVDDRGAALQLRSLFDGKRPVLLTLNYLACRALCDSQLRGLATGLTQLNWTPGRDYQLVSVSIDPEEDARALRSKAEQLTRSVRREAARWRMLRGDALTIDALARSVGFRYDYDAVTRQYAHAPLLIVLTPDGRVARYLQGIVYAARDLKLALLEAADGKLGDRADAALLSCFEFDVMTGRYSLAVLQLVRGGGVVMLLGYLGGVWWLRRRAGSSRSGEA